MHKIFSIFLIGIMLTSVLASTPMSNPPKSFAEDFSSLTDDELIELFQNQVTTIDQMGLILDEAAIIDVTKQKLMNLKNKVLTDVENQNIQSSLIQKIDNAIDKLDDATQFVDTLDEQQANNMMNAASNKINAFINSVEAQQGKKIPTELAEELIDDASEISSDLTKRDNDIIPVIQDFDLPLAKSLIDRSEIELQILRNVFAELDSRGVEIEITAVRNSSPFSNIKIKGISTVITALTESWATTNAVNVALIELDQQPLNEYEFVGLFMINASAFASLDLVLGDIPTEDQFVLDLVELVVGTINESDFVFDIYLPTLNEILASLLIPIEVEAIIALRDRFLPILTVITDVINDNEGTRIAGDFIVRIINAINPNPSSFTGVDGDGQEVRLAAGTYEVIQDPFEGYGFTFSDDCTSNVNGPLEPADRRTCVISTDDVAVSTDPIFDEIWQYKEHNRISAFPPNYTFTKLGSGDQPLHITSTIGGAGDSYVFKTFKKSDIENHNLRITWSGTSPVPSGNNQWNFFIVDGAFDRSSNTDFPTNSFPPVKGIGDLERLTISTQNFGPQTDTITPDWTSSQLDDVTIFARVTDSGVQRSITGTVNNIEIVNVAKWTFTDPTITAEVSGTLNDYGTYTSTCVGCDGSTPPPVTIFFEDDYSTNSGWTQVGSVVTVDSASFPNVVKYNNANGGSTTANNRVYQQLPSVLPDTWTAEFDYVFTSSTIPGHGILVLSPDSPVVSATRGDRIEVIHGVGSNTLTMQPGGPLASSISISPGVKYYVTLEKTPTSLTLNAFSDEDRTIHISNSPLIASIPNTYDDLQFIQHTSLNAGGARILTAEVDNTVIFVP